MPLQDATDGAGTDYWWPKMQCLVDAFREWQCDALLASSSSQDTVVRSQTDDCIRKP